VQNELTISAIAHLKVRLDVLVNNGDAVIQPIFMNTSEYALYTKLTSAPDKRHIIIGKGEAAAIALAFSSNGIVASNNMKDVAAYVAEFNLRHLTTGSILIKAFEESLITEQDGNQIWSMMLAKRRKIGAATFSDYLHSHIN
jgi:predicted nucleic acid-binding protein